MYENYQIFWQHKVLRLEICSNSVQILNPNLVGIQKCGEYQWYFIAFWIRWTVRFCSSNSVLRKGICHCLIIIESARPRATFVLEWVLQPTKQKSKTILKRRKSKHAESKTNHAWHNTAYELCKNR
jgi:hypothetical protein